jgi:hypothetical protein
MKLRLLILLAAAAALAAAPAAGQTIKSLGFNTSNGVVPTTALSNLPLTFTNTGGISGSSFDSGNVLMGSNTVTFYGTNSGLAFSAGANASQVRNQIGLGATWLTNTNVTNFRTAIGLGATNYPTFAGIEISGQDEMQLNGASIDAVGFGGKLDFEEQRLTQDSQTIFSWDTNSFAVTPSATFSTNVSIAGSLSVGSFTTTTPSTWALDATQTAAATNGVLTLPSNANVIRLTNNNAISSVTNGVLGAFYYLVNQATNAVTISNVGGITIDGAQNLTLSPNESATLVATGPTNVSVANRGDLTDVALGGTANTAPSQTASSGSSLMTRDLGDGRYLGLRSHIVNFSTFSTITANGGISSSFRGAWQIFTATDASSFASVWGEWAFLLGLSLNERYVNFSNPFSVSVSRTMQPAGALPRAGLTQFFQLGRDVDTMNTTNGKLAQKGVGIQFASNGVTPFVHNGTSLTDGSLITNVSTYNRFVLRWVPATAFEVYGVVNGSEPVLLGSVTNNLPSGNSASGTCLEFSQLDAGSGGANSWLWLNNAYITTP